MSTLTTISLVALGFGLGVVAACLLVTAVAGIALFGWWRMCQAIERSGLDIKIHQPDEAGA